MGDAELDQSKDPEFGIERFAILQSDAFFLLEKRIELFDKGRIKLEEGCIEGLVEISEFGLILISAKSFLELVKIAGAHRKKEPQVFFFGRIGFYKFEICEFKSLFSGFNGLIGLCKLFVLVFYLAGIQSGLEEESYRKNKQNEKKEGRCGYPVEEHLSFPVSFSLAVSICLFNHREDRCNLNLAELGIIEHGIIQTETDVSECPVGILWRNQLLGKR